MQTFRPAALGGPAGAGEPHLQRTVLANNGHRQPFKHGWERRSSVVYGLFRDVTLEMEIRRLFFRYTGQNLWYNGRKADIG